MVSGGNQATAAAGEGHGAAAVTRFALHVLRGRWFMFFASTMVMASGGGAYIFGAYSKAIKASFGYDQKTLGSLSFYKNLGASLGVLPGVISEVASPWVLLLAGAAMNLTGYLMIYLGVSGRTARPPVWLMCVYIACGATSQNFGSTGAMVTTVSNFPDDRGVVLGLLLGFAGLGGAILTQLHRSFDGAEDGAALLGLMAWLPTTILLLSTFAIRFKPRDRDTLTGTARGERKGVLGLLRVSVLAAVYLLILNVVELKVARLPRLAYYVTAILLLVILVISPLVVVVRQEVETYWILPRSSSTRSTPTTNSSASASRDAAGCVVTKKPSSTSGSQFHEDDVFANDNNHRPIGILQAVCSMDMLLLLVTTMCGVGGTLTVIDNMGQIGQSLGYSQRSISMLVALVSLSNYAGRVVAGLGSDYMVGSCKLPRPLALTVTQLVACVGHLLIALGERSGLYAASMVVGFSIGAHWTVLFAVISEVFGLTHFSVLYNLATLASPVGSYVLNVQVTGRLYDREARRQGRKDDDVLACVGVRCFKVPFMIVAGVTLVGAAASLLLVWRTWALYRERFRFSVTNAAAGVVTTDVASAAENEETVV